MSLACVVIVNWNGWSDTVECLESLYKMQGRPFDIVIVDNGSTDGSPERIEQWARGEMDVLPPKDPRLALLVRPPCPKPVRICSLDEESSAVFVERDSGGRPTLVLLKYTTNAGFAGGNNRGLRFAMEHGAEYIWFLNNDTLVDNGALDGILRRMEEEPSCGMCGSTLLFYNAPDRVQAYGGGYYAAILGLSWHIGFMKRFRKPPSPFRGEFFMNYVVGASLCVSREFIENIGPMSEDYFVFFEEVDWAFRSRGEYRVGYAPESIVYHKVGSSIGTNSNPLKRSAMCDFYNLRNRIRFTRRYSEWALPGVYTVLFFSVLLRFLLGQWRQAYVALQVIGGRQEEPIGVTFR